MDWPVTWLLATALLAATLGCGWAGSRPPDLQRGPRLVPWRFLMLVFAAGLLLVLVHMVNLAGVSTGRS